MTGFVLIAIFILFALGMYSGKLPAILALPLLAFSISIAAGIPYYYSLYPPDWSFLYKAGSAFMDANHIFFNVVVTQGVPRLNIAILTVMVGGVFGYFLKLTGISESLVRKVAELAGDNPFVITLILTMVISFLFTTLGGLGAIILVANIFFPILLSLGLPPLLIGCLFLMALSLGGVFNMVNWALYKDILGLPEQEILRYAVSLGGVSFIVLLVFLFVEFKKARLPVPIIAFGKTLVCVVFFLLSGVCLYKNFPVNPDLILHIKSGFKLGIAGLMFAPLFSRSLSWTTMLAPFIPISLVVALGWNIFPAFLFGIVFLFFSTVEITDPESISNRTKMLIQSAIEGIQGVTPAVALMLGIGVVLIAVSQPPVNDCLAPIVRSVLPSSPFSYVILFTILTPLSLYRGPLSIWGMGSGLMGLLKTTQILSGTQIMAAFMATGQMQGVCDPTNTHNVWIANQLKIELHAILNKTLPYMWAVSFFGLILGAYGK